MRTGIRMEALLAVTLFLAPRAMADTVIVIEPPEKQLEVHHHTRPFHGFTNALGGGGGALWRLIDRGVEKKREGKDKRIGRRILEAAGERRPTDELQQLIRGRMAAAGLTPIEQLELEKPLSTAGKKVFDPPAGIATNKMAVKMWRRANRFTDYRPLEEKGIRYVVEFRPSVLLESAGHKSQQGFMGIKSLVNVIDLSERQVKDQTPISVGFSAAGTLEAIPLSPDLWKSGETEGDAEPRRQLGQVVTQNLDSLLEMYAAKLERFAKEQAALRAERVAQK